MRLTGYQKNRKKTFFFQFSPHAGTVEENTLHFEVLLLFLSLRYGADLGRSRLVLKYASSSEKTLSVERKLNQILLTNLLLKK